jgi:hypothetical protein
VGEPVWHLVYKNHRISRRDLLTTRRFTDKGRNTFHVTRRFAILSGRGMSTRSRELFSTRLHYGFEREVRGRLNQPPVSVI